MKANVKKFISKVLYFFLITNLLLSIFLYFSGCGKGEEKKNIPDQMVKFKEMGKYGFVGYINNKKIYIEPQFDFAWDFSEGLAVVEIAGKQGYIDFTGETVIPPIYDRAYGFSEGMAKVRVGKKYGFIDKTGKLVIGYRFDDADKFEKGVAKVKIGKMRTYIDKSGNFVSNTQNITGTYNSMISDF